MKSFFGFFRICLSTRARTAVFLAAASAFLSAGQAEAATKSAILSGSWTNPATWGLSGIPVAGDTAAIGTVAVTVPAGYAAVCDIMTFSALNGPSTVILEDSTSALTVSGNVNLRVNTSGAGSNTLNVGAGTFSAGSVTLAGTSGSVKFTQIIISTGTATVSGNITSAGVNSRILFSDAGLLKVGGLFMSVATPGTFMPSTGTVMFTGAGQQIRATNYYSLVVNTGVGKTATLAGSPTIAGDLSVLSGTLDLSAYTADRASVGGALTVAANAGLVVGGTANFPVNYSTVTLDPLSTVSYANAGAQAVVVQPYGHLTLTGGGAKSIGAGTTVAGNVSVAPTGTATISVQDGMNLAVDSLTLGGLGRTNGTWGSSASAATYQNDVFFSPTTGYLTVNTDTRSAPLVATVPNATAISSGQALSESILSGGSATNALGETVDGTFAFTAPATIPPAGVYSAPVTFFPTDVMNYTTGSGSVDVEVLACTWRGTGDWFADTANWSNGVPGPGSHVWIASGSVTLTNATPPLGSFHMTSGTFLFSNFVSVVDATNVSIVGGTVRHAANSDTNGGDGWQVSSRVAFLCTNFTLQAPGLIDVNERGWGAPLTGNVAGYGPGAGGTRAGGAYGGFGGNMSRLGGQPYGSGETPDQPGSGGGAYGTVKGGFGGGFVRIEAQGGMATVNGTIRADGGQGGGNAGGGSGGGVFISCRTLAGTVGLITANGGLNNSTAGSGGGGRIAVAYDPESQSNAPACTVTFSARMGALNSYPGDLGTLWFPDYSLLGETVKHTGQWTAPGNAWAPATLTVTNGCIRFTAEGMRLTVPGDVTVTGAGAGLEIGGNALMGNSLFRDGIFNFGVASDMTEIPALVAGSDLILTNGGYVRLYSAPTNGTSYGSLLVVTGNLVVASASALYPVSDPTNGGSVLITASNVSVLAGGSINADRGGFCSGRIPLAERGFGPGGGISKGGGSHGGYGGNMANNGGRPCGDAQAPNLPGSGGGNDGVSGAGAGGGLIKIEADRIRVDGTLSANGSAPVGNAGASAGGGIHLKCLTFASQGGIIRATGNDAIGTAGGGGGGRISIEYDPVAQDSAEPVNVILLATGGAIGPYPGDLGTVFLPNTRFLQERVNVSGQVLGYSSWSPDSLLVSNRWIRFPDGFSLSVANDVTIDGSVGVLDLGGNKLFDNGIFRIENTAVTGLIRASEVPSLFSIGGNLVMTNGGDMWIYAGPTNAPSSYGATVEVAGVVSLGAGSWVYPVSEPTNGGSVVFSMAGLTLPAGSGFNADQAGFAGSGGSRLTGYGYGGGQYQGGGGGYGGVGGNVLKGGAVYGSADNPTEPGSGGGRGSTTLAGAGGGLGGGLIRLEVAGNVLLNGTLTAPGRNAGPSNGSGGGSGGGIFLRCQKLSGGGILRAAGGNGISGGSSGGGGRIAVASLNRMGFNGTATALAGTSGTVGEAGTVEWVDGRNSGTVIMLQ